jgi:hypothetical protein
MSDIGEFRALVHAQLEAQERSKRGAGLLPAAGLNNGVIDAEAERPLFESVMKAEGRSVARAQPEYGGKYRHVEERFQGWLAARQASVQFDIELLDLANKALAASDARRGDPGAARAAAEAFFPENELSAEPEPVDDGFACSSCGLTMAESRHLSAQRVFKTQRYCDGKYSETQVLQAVSDAENKVSKSVAEMSHLECYVELQDQWISEDACNSVEFEATYGRMELEAIRALLQERRAASSPVQP